MEVLKNKRILAIIGIIGLILGIMMPYYTVSIFGYSTSISLWGYWEGKVIFVLTLACGLIIFKDIIEKYIPQLFDNAIGRIVEKVNNPKIALIPTILVAAYAVYLIVSLDVSSEYIKYGIGFYILWVGIIALFGHAIFYKKQNTNSDSQVTNYSQQVGTTTYQQQSINQNTKYCPNCGNQIDANADNCFMCGTKF